MHPTGKNLFSRKVAVVVGQWVELHQFHLQQRTHSLLKEYFTDAAVSRETKAGNFKALQGNQPQGAPASVLQALLCGAGTQTPPARARGHRSRCQQEPRARRRAREGRSSRGRRPAAPTKSLTAAKLHVCSRSLVLQPQPAVPDRPRGAHPWGSRRAGSSSSERTAAWPGAWEPQPPAAQTPDPHCKTRSPPGSDPASSFLFLDLSF